MCGITCHLHSNYIPDLPDPDTPQITVRQVLNKYASSFNLEYDDTLDPNTVVALNAIATYDNNSNSGKNKVERIREIKELFDEGIIDEDEFKELKAEIIKE